MTRCTYDQYIDRMPTIGCLAHPLELNQFFPFCQDFLDKKFGIDKEKKIDSKNPKYRLFGLFRFFF